MKKDFFPKLLLLLILVSIAILVSLHLGSVKIPILNTAKILLSTFPVLGEGIDLTGIDETEIFIVLDIRLPRIIMAGLVGATLSLAGASFQAVFNNPMADPYILGVSAGAALGATVGIVLGVGTFGFAAISVFAFTGAVLSSLLVFSLGRIGGKINTVSVLLAGVVVGAILSSVTNFIMMMNQDNIHRIIAWTFGSFSAVTIEEVKYGWIFFVIGIILIMSLAKELNALVLGEELAQTMGINTERTKLLVLGVSSLMTAMAVSISGIIGFVGLVVPHLMRIIFGSNHKRLMPATVFGGAFFLIFSDTISRSLLETQEVPVGIITSLLGGPFFIYLLRNSKKKTEGR
ncbi:MAG: iron ABC transporter permease [Tissierellia bacterium]|nr:iron ABC transporter permease [Tissierellia bacterium]